MYPAGLLETITQLFSFTCFCYLSFHYLLFIISLNYKFTFVLYIGRSDRRERSTDRRERSTDRRERSTDRRERSTSRSRYPERPHSRSGSRPPSRSDYDDYYSNNPYYRARAYYRSYRYRGMGIRFFLILFL